MFALVLTALDILKFYIFHLQKVGQGTIAAMTTFNGNCQILQKIPAHCSASFYHLRDIKLKICYLQKIGQGHRVHFFSSTPFNGKC